MQDAEQSIADEIQFHFIKSNYFRVIHADGAWGGTSPRGAIHVNFYTERAPIPKVMSHSIESGQLRDEIREKRVTRDGFVREVDACVVLDLETAIGLRDWLNNKIEHLQTAKSEESPK